MKEHRLRWNNTLPKCWTLLTNLYVLHKGSLNWSPNSRATYNIPAGYYTGGTISTDNAYNQGYTDGYAASIRAVSIVSDYHIHSLSSTNDLSNSPTDSPYSDDYASTYPGGCFQTPYYNISYDVVTTSTGKVNQKFGIHLDTSTDASGDWWRCDYCGQGIG